MSKQQKPVTTEFDSRLKKEEKFALQAKIRASLYEKAEKKRSEIGVTWVRVMEELLQAWIDGEIK